MSRRDAGISFEAFTARVAARVAAADLDDLSEDYGRAADLTDALASLEREYARWRRN